MSELISIVVPVYNVKPFLDKCVKSLIEQTYKNIEIILVDDGSTDGCFEICDEWKKRDSRIIVIHQKNGGLSNARNTGISSSNGEYIMFIDSDDYVESTMVEILYNNLISLDVDLTICNFYYTVNGKDLRKGNLKGTFIIEGNEKYNYLYNEFSLRTIISWNKLYKKSLFDNLKFPDGLIHEDQFIIAPLLDKIKKIGFLMDDYLYHYVQRDNSIMKTFNMKRFDIIKGLNNRIEFFKNKKLDDFVLKTRVERVQSLHLLLKKCHHFGYDEKDKSIVENYEKTYRDELKYLKSEKNITFVSKLKVYLLYFCPKVYDLLKKI